MAAIVCRRICLDNFQNFIFVRKAHRMRGKPPGIARTLQQRLDELNFKDEIYTTRVNIGFPHLRSSERMQRLEHLKKQRHDDKLEKSARNHELKLDLDTVNKDWLANNGPHQIKTIADHYGIFRHLFDEGYFVPRVHLNIAYNNGADTALPVYYGNIIKPSDAAKSPEVRYDAEENTLWTLILSNLDGHFTDENNEYIHWCISNVPGNDISKGNEVVKYLQPIPPKGTGFHRFVYILYKQVDHVDYSISIGDPNCLSERTFNTRDWYSKYQDVVTPAGIAFFQSDWDSSLKNVFHNTLQMKEPVFEYDFPPPYIRPQKRFPLREPFNLYMDKYRDPKQVSKEYLMLKLSMEHPFKKGEPPLKYPNAHSFPKTTPSWLRLHERKIRMNHGRINDI